MADHDVPDLEAARRALEESERRYREVFETNTAVKLIIDPESGAIVDANAAASRFYGYRREELTQMRIQDINTMPPQRIYEEMDRARTEKRLYFSFQHRLASGEIRVDVYSGPLSVAGRKLLHSIIIDVTERRRLEGQLLRAQRMDTIGQLAGGLAHDFNNALTVILGRAEIGRLSVPDDHPAREAFDEIVDVSLRAAEVTRQLLTLARKQLVSPRSIDVREIVEGTNTFLRRLLGEHVEIAKILASDAWPVFIDPGQVEQLLVNLAVNGRDAMPNGGTLTIETANVQLERSAAAARGLEPGRWVLLRVTDTGLGISEDTQRRIFEPFFTTKEPHLGTGLGLATCQAIVEHAGGRIVVTSARGEGTTVDAFLPASDTVAESSSAKPIHERLGGDETLLVVEDEPMLRRLLTSTLRARGYRVLTAGRGEEALLRDEEHTDRLDLLVTDVVMPRMSGVELARQLRLRRADLPVLFLSGYPAGLLDSAELGPNSAFLDKPFVPDDLAHAVRELLDTAQQRTRTSPS
jgi:hypothetical protein